MEPYQKYLETIIVPARRSHLLVFSKYEFLKISQNVRKTFVAKDCVAANISSSLVQYLFATFFIDYWWLFLTDNS